ncbi:MAG: hypothetical protein HDR88_17975, partial [Bacteroides sp.]|nr:hypothetical protein [Bacteroides sp.]
MGKLYSIISALLMSVGSALAAEPAGYEWWFDNDVSTLQSGTVSGERFDIPIDLSDLSKGTHYFNCRLHTADGKWGSVYRKMFFTVDNTTGAVAYEYWFDNDYDAKKVGEITTGSMSFEVDASPMIPGTHYFNCRLFTNQGGWGAVYRQMVFTTGTMMDATAYEYWIDDNYDSKVEGTISAGANTYTVNLQGTRKGLHRFNYRIRTGAGTWGSVYSKYFFYSTAKTPFTLYEYWLDNDYANRKTGTTSNNPVNFEVDLTGFDKSGEAHYFNLRVRDDDGDWSSFYRKLILFYNNDKKAPLIGYRHSMNGTDLGYVKVERQITDSYTFTIDLPEDLGFSLKDKELKFDGDKVSVGGNDSIHYCLQIESELGWAPPQTWDFEASHDFATTAVAMSVNSSHTFDNPLSGEFVAVKFTAADTPLYVRADAPVTLDLYRDGSKVKELTGEEVAAMAMLELEAGEYFGILYGAETESDQFTFHLMDTPNSVPTPEITFNNGMVSITCSRDDAEIHYTLNEGAPTPGSEGTMPYSEPFALDHNAVVKAIAIIPDSDIDSSAIAELVVNSYKVADPVVSFDNLMLVITQDQHEGVHTFYTLDGKEPTEESTEYNAPFSLTGNAKVLVRSFKEGYNPSNVVEYNHSHSIYVTGVPEISVEGTTVTLTATTEGSTLYYSIDDPNPEQEYTAPFEMAVNGTIYAQARKSGMYDSEIVSYEVNSNKVGNPSI